jgi:hypothetical protein
MTSSSGDDEWSTRFSGSSTRPGRRRSLRITSRIRFITDCRRYASSAPGWRASNPSSRRSAAIAVSCTRSAVSIMPRLVTGRRPCAHRCSGGMHRPRIWSSARLSPCLTLSSRSIVASAPRGSRGTPPRDAETRASGIVSFVPEVRADISPWRGVWVSMCAEIGAAVTGASFEVVAGFRTVRSVALRTSRLTGQNVAAARSVQPAQRPGWPAVSRPPRSAGSGTKRSVPAFFWPEGA